MVVTAVSSATTSTSPSPVTVHSSLKPVLSSVTVYVPGTRLVQVKVSPLTNVLVAKKPSGPVTVISNSGNCSMLSFYQTFR